MKTELIEEVDEIPFPRIWTIDLTNLLLDALIEAIRIHGHSDQRLKSVHWAVAERAIFAKTTEFTPGAIRSRYYNLKKEYNAWKEMKSDKKDWNWEEGVPNAPLKQIDKYFRQTQDSSNFSYYGVPIRKKNG